MDQTSLFPTDNNLDSEDASQTAQQETVDKDLYDGLVARERYRKARMDNDLRAKRLIYSDEADSVLRECIGIVFSALTNDIDALPDQLHGKSRGELREALVARYRAIVAQAENRLSEYLDGLPTGEPG